MQHEKGKIVFFFKNPASIGWVSAGEWMSGKQIIFQTDLPVPVEKAYAWHLRKGALERLLPPWMDISFLFPPSLPEKEGGEVCLRLRKGPFSFKWILTHKHCIPHQEFTAVQRQGPFRHYVHRHCFFPLDSFSSRLIDEVAFSLPFLNKKIESELCRFLRWRDEILKADLKLYDSYPKAPMQILMSGTSGFIGSRLKNFLQLAGHHVVRLVRRKEEVGEDAIFWDPIHGEVVKEDFEGFDAVIHLAGAGIANGRWTKKRKESLFLSRCRDTWLLSQVLCRLYQPPRIVISASAIGFYGSRGDAELTEESPGGKGFLSHLCQEWERATDAIENRGARVVHPRFGAVLGARGGVLQKMIGPFRWGCGGKLGSGKQKVSWIGIDDLLGGIYHCLMTDAINGPVNFTAPQPVNQEEFAHLLAKKVKRPAFCHVPAFALKLMFGEMADELLLASQNVLPKKLQETGYVFRYPDLKTALDFVM